MNPIVDSIRSLRQRPRLLMAVFSAALGLFVLYDVYAPRHEAHFVGDDIRGFWALFGFFGCVILARFMKGIGHLWLMKPVDYYDRDRGEE